jgi:hypothetical protein
MDAFVDIFLAEIFRVDILSVILATLLPVSCVAVYAPMLSDYFRGSGCFMKNRVTQWGLAFLVGGVHFSPSVEKHSGYFGLIRVRRRM